MSWEPYDNTGSEYKVERVLNEDGTFDLEQYKAYSPLFLSFVPRSTRILTFPDFNNPCFQHLVCDRIWTFLRFHYSNHRALDTVLLETYPGPPSTFSAGTT